MAEGSDRSDEVRHAASQDDDEVAAARAEVEQARAEMTQTVDALQEKLDPQNLEEQAKAQAAEVARAKGQQMLEAVRRKPIPVAVVGGVLFLLLVRRLRAGGTR